MTRLPPSSLASVRNIPEPSGVWKGMQRLVRFGLVWAGVAVLAAGPSALHAAAPHADAHPGGASSPITYFALFGGAFLLLSFVLILIGPRNDRRR